MDSNVEFLGKDVLENVIQNIIGSKVMVKNVVKVTFPLGESYNGEVVRLKIRFCAMDSLEERQLSIVAKYLPDDEFLIKFAEEMKSFSREMLMYEKTLPQMYSFGCLETIAPKAYLISNNPRPTLLLEDLSTTNFQLLPRRKGFDFVHCLYALDKLASFHATSVSLFEKDSSSMNHYDQALYSDVYGMRGLLAAGLQELIQTCNRLPELTMYSAKLQLLQKDFLNSVIAATQVSSTFNVLNHGDLWNSNIMFSHHTNGEISGIRFLDYQGLHFTSPATDLHFCITVAANSEAKLRSDALLRHYFKNLIHYLLSLKVKITLPTWDDFIGDFRSRICYGIAAAILHLPVARADKRSDSSITNFLNSEGEDGFRYHALNNDRYLQEIKILLPMYDEFFLSKL
ncbi:hypothetical protein RI129_011258 [Pyrocoelia pectoralis]|uniref:CHK kinase-like domain-containing protein n=1 Tax=Pyrocoelia pectoralis TaxID=417401 RepID=A0AAN7ZFB2_9COLE